MIHTYYQYTESYSKIKNKKKYCTEIVFYTSSIATIEFTRLEFWILLFRDM